MSTGTIIGAFLCGGFAGLLLYLIEPDLGEESGFKVWAYILFGLCGALLAALLITTVFDVIKSFGKKKKNKPKTEDQAFRGFLSFYF